MVARSSGGITLLRRKRRLLDALAALRENKILNEREYQDRRKLVEFQYDRWRDAWRKTLPPPRKRGRPKLEDRSIFTTCKLPGCGNPPAKGQAYCDPSHAPFAHLMQPERKKR